MNNFHRLMSNKLSIRWRINQKKRKHWKKIQVSSRKNVEYFIDTNDKFMWLSSNGQWTHLKHEQQIENEGKNKIKLNSVFSTGRTKSFSHCTVLSIGTKRQINNETRKKIHFSIILCLLSPFELAVCLACTSGRKESQTIGSFTQTRECSGIIVFVKSNSK